MSESEEDYHTGSMTEYSLHIDRVDKKPLCYRELKYIHEELWLSGRGPQSRKQQVADERRWRKVRREQDVKQAAAIRAQGQQRGRFV